MKIQVVATGLFTTVQDAGRFGFQAFGVPVAGAMDGYAFRVANLLVGNPLDAAVLEMTLTGDILQFPEDSYVAVCGANMQGKLNGEPITNWSSFAVPAGSELAFGFAQEGCRTYIAVRGGIDVPVVLGSRSTYTRASIGGLEGRKLQAGDLLPVGKLAMTTGYCEKVLPERYCRQYPTSIILRVLPGPQEELFTAEGLGTLFNSSYTLSNEADRMGFRLEGPQIAHKAKADIVSDALCQGAIQVPGHGMPIVMMADRQTTGGYAKIGTVISSDLMFLAQAKPGDTITFRQCSYHGVVAALRAEHERYSEIQTWWKQERRMQGELIQNYRVTVNGWAYDVQISGE